MNQTVYNISTFHNTVWLSRLLSSIGQLIHINYILYIPISVLRFNIYYIFTMYNVHCLNSNNF